ncbi:ribonuclease Rne/Rng family [Clostridium sp. CAG:575]|nr:ribonuclease Rne/Rng family [Clostridium sp. CAG:575]
MLEIFINKNTENKEIALLENGHLVEYYIDEGNDLRKEGNIYIGIVKDVIKGMQAAFVDIGTEKNSFIHLKDLLPKIDETKNNVKNEKNSNIEISQIIKNNDAILVQVKKDSNALKGARVSTHINLPSKYIALMPDTDIITASQKIEDKKEQERLIKLVKENITSENGAIIRTSAIGKEKEIIEDIKYIESKWKKIKEKYQQEAKTKEPKLIYKSENIIEKMTLDLPDNSLQRILTNNEKEYNRLLKLQKENAYLQKAKIEFKKEEILDIYDTKKQIEKLQNRKIWLKCGGFITIDKTEALTAIDVNTGKYTGTKDVEQTIYKVNEEATIEITKQLRLRDIGGIVIIDYIDMNNNENKEKIQKLLIENLKNDRAKTQVEGFTKLDLMEMTRKHIMSHRDSSCERNYH